MTLRYEVRQWIDARVNGVVVPGGHVGFFGDLAEAVKVADAPKRYIYDWQEQKLSVDLAGTWQDCRYANPTLAYNSALKAAGRAVAVAA